jgi:GMP synthase (glutamine-hydrolysing)
MIVVLDFGGQFAHLIARRVRDLGVYSEIVSPDISVSELKKMKPCGIIFSGGPSSVLEKDSPTASKELLDLGIPVLGICYGQQLIAKLEGGRVEHKEEKEFGKEEVSTQSCPLFKGLAKKEIVWFSHGDQVEELTKGYEIIASTNTCKIAGVENKKKKIYGVQFHPEVVHTPCGNQILKNFLFDIAGCEKNWQVENFEKQLIEEVKETVGDESVLIAVSGGVDSTVAATLIHEAIGDRLHCVFVDTGMMRKNEPEEIDEVFKNLKFKNFYHVKAGSEFISRLKGVVDPEEKRKIIGHLFIETFEKKAEELKKVADIKFLAQGTIYPDRIESAKASKNAAVIKSHHNLTLPEKLALEILEPLKNLYKDEVRALGEVLGIEKNILYRHPFPGPGLAIRILGAVDEEKLEILRNSDDIYTKYLKESGLYDQIWQAFAALIPVKAVGVKGDARTYEYIIALRAVNSVDGMTADWFKMPYEDLEKISNSILNRVRGASRVLYDVSQKPPATIEYE